MPSTRQTCRPASALGAARTTLALDAYRALREDIIQARLEPGKKLHIQNICKKLKIGLSPVREALNRLASEKLVVQSAQRGFTVSAVSLTDLEDLTRAKCWLNEIGIRESITHGDAKWEEELVLAFHRLSRINHYLDANERKRNPAWDTVHRDFHAALIAASRSEWLKAFSQVLFDASERYRAIARLTPIARKTHLEEHRKIMEAALARDIPLATKLLTAHFMLTARLVSAQLKRKQPHADQFRI